MEICDNTGCLVKLLVILCSVTMITCCSPYLEVTGMGKNIDDMCVYDQNGQDVKMTIKAGNNCAAWTIVEASWKFYALISESDFVMINEDSLYLEKNASSENSLQVQITDLNIYGVVADVTLGGTDIPVTISITGYFTVHCADRGKGGMCAGVVHMLRQIDLKDKDLQQCTDVEAAVYQDLFQNPSSLISGTYSVDITMRCTSNCDRRVNSQESIQLHLKYQGSPSNVEEYRWTLCYCENSSVSSCTVDSITYPHLSQSQFFSYSLENKTLVAKIHAVFVTVVFKDGRKNDAFYMWRYGGLPVVGTCDIVPETGYALFTEYNITCQRFSVEEDMQLEYKIFTNTKDTLKKSVMIQSGSSTNVTNVKLQQGNEDTNYTVYVLVKASIPNGAFVTSTAEAQVYPASLAQVGNSILNVIEDLVSVGDDSGTSPLSELFNQGNQDEALHLINMILHSINADREGQDNETQYNQTVIKQRNQIQTVIVDNLAEVNLSSYDLVSTTAIVLNEASQGIMQLSEQTQDKVSDIYDSLADSLNIFQGESSSSGIIDTAGSILSGVTNILDLKTDEGRGQWSHDTTDVDEIGDETSKEKMKNEFRKLLKTVNKVCSVLLSKQIPGQNATVVQTHTLTVTVQKVHMLDLTGKTLAADGDQQNPAASFVFPASFQDDVGDEEHIGVQMLYMKKNPYIWDATARNVNSEVLSVELKKTQNTELKVSSLEKPVRVNFKSPVITKQTSDTLLLNLIKTQDNVTFNMSKTNIMTYNFTVSPNKTTTFTLKVAGNITLKLLISDTKKPPLTDVIYSGYLYPHDIQSLNSFAWFDLVQYNLSTAIFKQDNDGTVFFTNYNESSSPRQYFASFTVDLNDTVTMETLQAMDEDCLGNDFMMPCLSLIEIPVSVETKTLSCVYWDNGAQEWSRKGCEVSPYSTGTTLECLCSHLTAFAGSVLVLPNFIDPIADAALFLTFFDNPVVVTTVILIWVVYVFLTHWARRADKKDTERVGVIVCSDNDPTHRNMYLLCVTTGWRMHAGTSANVFFYMKGSEGVSPRRRLSTSARACFQSGYNDWFLLTTEDSLGDLQEITLWHDNMGTSPHWYLNQVYVKDLQLSKSWTFIYNDWLAIDRGSLLHTTATVTAVSEDQLKLEQKYNFMVKSSQDLRDGHLWISIFSKPPCSTFTRVQRLTCALSLVLTTMLTNIMFYGIPTDDSDDQVGGAGGMVISLSSVVIGIESSLIMFPINLIILQLFLKLKPKPQRREKICVKDQKEAQSHLDMRRDRGLFIGQKLMSNVIKIIALPSKEMEEELVLKAVNTEDLVERSNISSCGTFVTASENIHVKEVVSEAQVTNKIQEDFILRNDGNKNKSKILPWWFLYITWTLVMFTCIISSYFVMLYGLKYGYTRSVQWLISFLTGFMQSAFVTQPLKVFAVAIVITLVFKKTAEFDDFGPGIQLDNDEEYLGNVCERPETHLPYIEPLSNMFITRIKQRLKLEWLMDITLRDIGLYFIYLSIVMVVVHGHRDMKQAYYNTLALEDVLINPGCIKLYQCFFLEKADNVEKFYQYLYEVAIPNLADMSISDHDYATPGSNHFLVGSYRLRQLRTEKGICTSSADWIVQKFNIALSECTGPYWLGDQDFGHYNKTWAQRYTETPALVTPWVHQSAWKLKTIPFSGKHATYSGGGYVLIMPSDPSLHNDIIQDMWNTDWIDERTRAVFLEFTLYNPNADLFSVVVILFEFTNSGAVFPTHQIFSTRLYHYSTDSGIAIAVCEILYLCFNICFACIEYKRYKKMGRKEYFKDFWSYVEILQICLSYSVIGLFFQRMVSLNEILDNYRTSSRGQYVSFYTAISWDFILGYVMAFLVAIVNLKSIKLLRYNKRVFMISDTLTFSKKMIASFFFMVMVFALGFGHFTMLAFGRVLNDYKSLPSSLITLFNFALRVSDLPGLQGTNRVLGPIYFVGFVFVTQFCFLTIFVAILNFGIIEAKALKRKNQFELVKYVVNKLKCLAKINIANAHKHL